MGQKTHPLGFRVGVTKDWSSRWFSNKNYAKHALKDHEIREFLRKKLKNAGLKDIEIERSAGLLRITVYVLRPGLVIGRGGSAVELLRKELRKLAKDNKVELVIEEVRNWELSAVLVAQEIARQIERRLPSRRAANSVVKKVSEKKEVLGIKVVCSGVLSGPSSISRSEQFSKGSVPTQTLRANIDFARATAFTTYGTIGVKVWLYLGHENIKTQEH